MYRLISKIVAGLATIAVLTGCSGTSGGASTSPYAGTYSGSTYSSDGTASGTSIGSIGLNISQNGQISGTTSRQVRGTASTISGRVSSNGAVNITATNPDGNTHSVTGTFHLNSAGKLTGSLVEAISLGTTYLTVSSNTSSVVYAGSYTGTFSSEGGGSGTVSLVVAANGAVTGTSTESSNTFTLTGTLSSGGATSITATPTEGSAHTSRGGAAFSQNGHLMCILADVENPTATTTIDLVSN